MCPEIIEFGPKSPENLILIYTSNTSLKRFRLKVVKNNWRTAWIYYEELDIFVDNHFKFFKQN